MLLNRKDREKLKKLEETNKLNQILLSIRDNNSPDPKIAIVNGEIIVLNDIIGRLLLVRNKLKESLAFYESLICLTKIIEKEQKHTYDKGMIFHNYAETLRCLRQDRKAKIWYRKAFKEDECTDPKSFKRKPAYLMSKNYKLFKLKGKTCQKKSSQKSRTQNSRRTNLKKRKSKPRY